ncbi:non-ribosomal peptide synthetase [Phytohalomonas tamaricis]|uniref:non-ribosomal peptide synthetase n=1 Tax=Phytohalomonas tamaricis TaxID=2081032 RepID=UPI000D0AD9D0|nr:non-ribosomal peptide synthetase [Phytohalomonas tamaricis]
MEIGKTLPLTGGQAGIWYAQQLDVAHAAYNTGQCLEIHGHVALDLLAAAIRQAVNESESLHVRIHDGEEGPCQYPHAPQEWTLGQLDFSTVVEPRAEAWRWMNETLKRSVNFTEGPLFKQALLVLGDGHVLWFSSIHHIAADAYSYGLLQQRVAEIYAALSQQRMPKPAWFGSLEQLVVETTTYLESEQLGKDQCFWRERFSSDPEPVSLAGRFAMASAFAHKRQETLPSAQVIALTRAAQACKASLPELLLAAIGAYLCRMTGKDNVTLGLPMMGRMLPVALRTPATQVNVLPFRLPLTHEHGAGEWVEATKREMRDVRRHQRYRYEWLQRDLQRRLPNRPLFGPHVNILPYTQPHLWEGCETHTHHLATGPVDDMTFSLYLGSDSGELHIALESNPSLYSLERTQWHLERLIHWLGLFSSSTCNVTDGRSAAENGTDTAPGIGTLDVLMPKEKQLLEDWNATAQKVEDTDLATLFERQVAHTPKQCALVFANTSLDYAELNAQANRLARLLMAAGVEHGDIVGIAVPRSLALEIALLAVHKAGGAYMPLASDYPKERLAYMIEQARPAVIVAHSSQLEMLPTDDNTATVKVIIDSEETATTLETLSGDNLDGSGRNAGDPAYLIFTSGSTGKPKGVLVEHRAIVNRLLWMQGEYGLQAGDRVLQKTPAGFDVSVWEFFWPLISGATLVMARPEGHKDPRYLSELIIREGITTLHFVPSMLRAFLDEIDDVTAAAMGGLRRVFVSGEALSKELQERFFAKLNAELHNLYGPTEAAVDVTYWPCTQNETRTTVPIGRPIWNTQIHILDDTLRPMPVGSIGELYIAGRNLAREYIGRPDLTAERFVANPFAAGERMYRSGDLACWNEDGTIDYVGRIDHQVKLRGLRIELDEIEAVLVEYPAIAKGVVSVYSSDQVDATLVAYAVVNDKVDKEALRQHLARQLPTYMVPSHIVFLDALPLTANGKLDRKALPAPMLAATGEDRPQTPQEQILCELFSAALGLERVGIHDNFFDLGGHSLLAVQLARQIRDRLGWEVSIATLFEAPSVAQLAAVGDTAQIDDALDVLLPLRTAASHNPYIFCIHPAGGLSWCYSGLTRFIPVEYGIYGVQARGLKTTQQSGAALPQTMDDMARDYLEQIRCVQPQGPYYLLGWSVGGMIAHTVAALLQESGEKVGMLALLDAYPSDLWRDMAPPGEAQALTALLRIAGFGQHEDAGLTRQEVIELLKNEAHAMASLPQQTLDALVDVVINNSRLVRDSHHRLFEGDVLFFSAARPRAETWLTRDAWHPYINGRLINVDIDCDHPTMLQPENVKPIGTYLEKALKTHEPVTI